ncbi:MAG: hypothetical protein QOG18_1625, partial [Microbacteriaceae bacterium]|nr:hypothetical protein [Microbacteriaceae bacterium]
DVAGEAAGSGDVVVKLCSLLGSGQSPENPIA